MAATLARPAGLPALRVNAGVLLGATVPAPGSNLTFGGSAGPCGPMSCLEIDVSGTRRTAGGKSVMMAAGILIQHRDTARRVRWYASGGLAA